jgi:2-keto-3-deoxy-L-rhamnonate aldolase RhmA
MSYDECICMVGEASRKHGKSAGILLRDVTDVVRLRDRGFSHFVVDSDLSILRKKYQKILRDTWEIRGAPSPGLNNEPSVKGSPSGS